jgi:predicted Fe-Mo cluster-binding NifX family protein
MNESNPSQAKRLVVACDSNLGLHSPVSQHFGRCPNYAVVEADGAIIQTCRVVSNPHLTDHTPRVVPDFIAGLGADVVLAGGMGPRAIACFAEKGIEVATGVAGSVQAVVQSYLRGEQLGVAPCAEGHRRHACHHHEPTEGGGS